MCILYLEALIRYYFTHLLLAGKGSTVIPFSSVFLGVYGLGFCPSDAEEFSPGTLQRNHPFLCVVGPPFQR